MTKIAWSREPRHKGLAGIVQVSLGWIMKIDGERVGTVARQSRLDSEKGYYWYARIGDTTRNTASDPPYNTPLEAAQACDAWVRVTLGLKPRATPLSLRGKQ